MLTNSFDASSAYTIRQQSSGRFLDAWQNEEKDFLVVTRPQQNNATQQWSFTQRGWAHRIRQQSSGRFLDAWQDEGHDFSVVTRLEQNNASQIWLETDNAGNQALMPSRFRQLSTGRFLDAWQDEGHDFAVVTRPEQNNASQFWRRSGINNIPPWGLIQMSKFVPSPFNFGSMFMDAWQDGGNDFSVVNRPHQSNNTQEWVFETVGFIYEIQQVSSQRYLDAYQNQQDWAAVTRLHQANETQHWIVLPAADGTWMIQQLSNRRFLDAYQGSNDYAAVTRTNQNNDTQRWLITEV